MDPWMPLESCKGGCALYVIRNSCWAYVSTRPSVAMSYMLTHMKHQNPLANTGGCH